MNVMVDLGLRRLYLAVAMGMDIRNVELIKTSKKIKDTLFLFTSNHLSMNSELTLGEDIFK